MFKLYDDAKKHAQGLANQLGYDHGVEHNKLLLEYTVFMLPQKKNRCGHELRCEVVYCEKLENCKPGHGPCA